jgi:hypothetical protein
MHSVKKIWRWRCKGQFAALVTPTAKSEQILVSSQTVISEIKDGEHLANDALPRKSDPRSAGRLSASDSRNRRASVKVRSVEKVRRGVCEVRQQWRKDVLCQSNCDR